MARSVTLGGGFVLPDSGRASLTIAHAPQVETTAAHPSQRARCSSAPGRALGSQGNAAREIGRERGAGPLISHAPGTDVPACGAACRGRPSAVLNLE